MWPCLHAATDQVMVSWQHQEFWTCVKASSSNVDCCLTASHGGILWHEPRIRLLQI